MHNVQIYTLQLYTKLTWLLVKVVIKLSLNLKKLLNQNNKSSLRYGKPVPLIRMVEVELAKSVEFKLNSNKLDPIY